MSRSMQTKCFREVDEIIQWSDTVLSESAEPEMESGIFE